jgi:hypothetical protein
VATLPGASGYTPNVHMPLIEPPATGMDPKTHYAGITAKITATPLSDKSLEISVSDPAKAQLYAMTGGFVFFIPQTKLLPTDPATVAPVPTLQLEVHGVDIDSLKKRLPPGVPAMLNVLYVNVRPNTVRAALEPHVRALPMQELELKWTLQASPANLDTLVTNYLDRVMLGEVPVFVPGGTPLGEAERQTPGNPASPTVFVLRLLDRAKKVTSPILHLRGMPSYADPKWEGHPLVEALAGTPIPVAIYLKFEVWNLTTKKFDPVSNLPVKLMNYDPVSSSDPLDTQNTNSDGKVQFAIANLQTLDEPQPDLYFLVETGGASRGGHTLPAEWSTKEWQATDGSPGYYPDFIGTQLGDAANPLVFRIGLDYHVRLTYKDQRIANAIAGTTVGVTNGSSTVTGTATKWKSKPAWTPPPVAAPAGTPPTIWNVSLVGMNFRVAPDNANYTIATVVSDTQLTLTEPYEGPSASGMQYTIDPPAPPRIPINLYVMPFGTHSPSSVGEDNPYPSDAEHLTDVDGEIHGVLFDVDGGADTHFGVRFENKDSAINLPKTTLTPVRHRWVTSWADADQVAFPDNADPSLGTQAQPVVLRCTARGEGSVSLFLLKLMREFSTFLAWATGGMWTGVSELEIVPWALAASWSNPLGSVHIAKADHWDRGTIIHELFHQVVYREVNYTAGGILYDELLGELRMKHYIQLLYTTELALFEGWGYFANQIFVWMKSPPHISLSEGLVTVTKGSPTVLGSAPPSATAWPPLPPNCVFFVPGDVARYKIVAASLGTTPQTLQLDRPYEGTTKVGHQPYFIHEPVYDKATANYISAFPPPTSPLNGQGERVEGDFANGIWALFERFVATPNLGPGELPRMGESLNGGLPDKATWVQQTATRDEFIKIIWKPLKALAPLSNPTSTDYLAKIKAENATRWHEFAPLLHQFNLAVAVPTVVSMSPASGPTAGGQAVTITGMHFTSGMHVTIGGQPATNVAASSDTTLTARTPAHASGTVDVLVKNLCGTATLAGGYTYA